MKLVSFEVEWAKMHRKFWLVLAASLSLQHTEAEGFATLRLQGVLLALLHRKSIEIPCDMLTWKTAVQEGAT